MTGKFHNFIKNIVFVVVNHPTRGVVLMKILDGDRLHLEADLLVKADPNGVKTEEELELHEEKNR